MTGDRPRGTGAATAESTPGDAVRGRKAEHLELALGTTVEPLSGPGWDDVSLVHEALPECDLDEVSLRTRLLGHELRAPLVIAAMTGGHPSATLFNARLGAAAQRHGLAIGVGSQRAALLDPSLAATYGIVREQAPDAFVLANVGAPQLIAQGERPALAVAEVRRAVEMVAADALAVHLNFVEELVQPEGDSRSRGCAEAIGRLIEELDVPVVVKETGAGISPPTAERLRELGVAALDVGGAGGTSFALIEQARAARQNDLQGMDLGKLFADWGIPTAVAVAGASRTGLPVIATGGVRSGLDAAKAIALGATAVGIGRPLLSAAVDGEAALDDWIERFRSQLRAVLMLTGCRAPDDLRNRPLVIGGRVRRWLEDLDWRPGPRAEPPPGGAGAQDGPA